MSNKYFLLFMGMFSLILFSCSTSKKTSVYERKIAPTELQKDYKLFRNILEELHPSLYWFTPKDSMDAHFNQVYSGLNDSLTEQQFRNLLNFTTNRIRCGHTAVFPSKKYSRYLTHARLKTFPLALKCWPDTAVVYASLIREDTLLKRGTVILSIDGRPIKQLLDTMLLHINGDGYSVSGRYQFLSNRGTFGAVYRNLFELPDSLRIEYLDSIGNKRITLYPVFIPRKDTLIAKDSIKREIRQKSVPHVVTKRIEIDTSASTAFMELHTFERKHGLTRFFRKSFKTLKRRNIENLVIDLRSNGGGDAGLATLLTRYITDHRFRVADSLYCIKRSSRYREYIHWQPAYWFFSLFVTRKQSDGNFHFGVFERHYFNPKKKYNYNGKVYLLTGGNSFSATTIFAQEVKGQDNVTIVGEETGGGAYGNTAWMIPVVTLPNTKLRFRIPKFRMVMEPALVAGGRGVMPDVQVAPTAEDIRKGVDVKVKKVKELIGD